MNRLLHEEADAVHASETAARGRPRSLPDTVEEKLSGRGVARRTRFNAFGTLLAVGTADGAVVLWDFGTRAVRCTRMMCALKEFVCEREV